MKTLTKLGITSLSLLTLGVVAPVVAPVAFGGNVVYAEEPQNQERMLGIFSAGYDSDGKYLPEVNFGSQTVTVTPATPYIVNQPEVEGWEATGARYIKEGEYSDTEVGNGTKITYDDLPETEEGVYSGSITYTYKRPSQPIPNPQPETPAEQPQTPPEVPATKPETPAEKPSDKPAEKPTEEPAKPAQPETPATKPAEEPQKPADKPAEPAKPEVPATKPETPAEKPSDKPAEKPTTPVKPMDKPATKPTDTNKPVVKPADNGKPEVKPTEQSGTAAANAQTSAPKADTKAPVAAAPKADKPAEKKMETLPNTGEAQSTFALLGLALGVLGLQGLTYKGRHDRKR